jgi:hypothetical protein
MPQTVSAVIGSDGRPRHFDVARAQEARDAVVALLAVEVAEVVVLRVRRLDPPRS